MPGIAGIIRRQPYAEIDRDLSIMVESMRHEAYYVGGQYVNREVGVYTGWLSQPGTLGAFMPLVSQDKRVVLIIVGEHFSNLSKNIPVNGDGQADSATHSLLRLYEQSENEFLNFLNGWFSGIAVDLNRGKVTLFNDRYGMNRVYFHENQEEFIFASEAKSLLRIRPALRAIEPSALAQYLRSNCVMGNKTLFKGISLLPGASSWAFSGGGPAQKRAYFDFADWEQQPTLKPEEFQSKFDETVSAVFPSYMEDTERVGLSLTAGLDTRVVLAAASAHKGSLPCYTFGGLWGETFDIRTARRLAQLSKQTHQVMRIDEHFLREFPRYARKSVFISDGTHDALHGAHDVYFNEIAREIAPIRLTGKFGSEVVRVRRLIPWGDIPRHLMQPGMVPFLNQAPSFEQVSGRAHPLSRVVAEEIPWYEFGRVSVEQAGIILRTPYMDNQLVRLMYQAPAALRTSRDLQSKYIWRESPGLCDVPTNMGRVRENGGLMGRFAYGLYWALFKQEFIYLYSTPHWLTRLDRTFERLRPERILAGRQKFEAYRIWLKTHLSDFVREVLLNRQARFTEFFDKAWAEKIVARHLAGTHNYMDEINKMLTVELICSSLLVPYSAPGAGGSPAQAKLAPTQGVPMVSARPQRGSPEGR